MLRWVLVNTSIRLFGQNLFLRFFTRPIKWDGNECFQSCLLFVIFIIAAGFSSRIEVKCALALA